MPRAQHGAKCIWRSIETAACDSSPALNLRTNKSQQRLDVIGHGVNTAQKFKRYIKTTQGKTRVKVNRDVPKVYFDGAK